MAASDIHKSYNFVAPGVSRNQARNASNSRQIMKDMLRERTKSPDKMFEPDQRFKMINGKRHALFPEVSDRSPSPNLTKYKNKDLKLTPLSKHRDVEVKAPKKVKLKNKLKISPLHQELKNKLSPLNLDAFIDNSNSKQAHEINIRPINRDASASPSSPRISIAPPQQ